MVRAMTKEVAVGLQTSEGKGEKAKMTLIKTHANKFIHNTARIVDIRAGNILEIG